MKSLATFLQNKDSPLAAILEKARQLQYLNQVFATLVDKDLAQHCFITSITKTQLHITTNSAAWATKLRYSIPEILKTINTQPEFQTITKIKFSVGCF